MVAVLVLSLTGVGLMSLGVQGRIRAVRTADEISARCAADAGLTKSVFQMNVLLGKGLLGRTDYTDFLSGDDNVLLPNLDGGWFLGESEHLGNSKSIFNYKVLQMRPGSYREFVITSVGTCNRAVKTVSATIGLKSIFDSAILVKDRMSLMPGTLITGYNSLDPTDTDPDLKIGTTSIDADRIPIGPGTVIEGDIFVGVGGDPETVIGAGGTIEGQKYSLTEEIDFPEIVPPALPDKGTDLSVKGATITLKPSDSGIYSGITLSQSAGTQGILEITGGDVVLHIDGSIDMGRGCELIVRPGSTLTLYVDGNISADNSVGFNNEAGHVTDFKIFGTGGSDQVFDLKAKSSMFGAVYAPNAEVNVYPGSEIHGSIVAETVWFKSGVDFYYDEALREVDIDDIGVRFIVQRWSEQ